MTIDTEDGVGTISIKPGAYTDRCYDGGQTFVDERWRMSQLKKRLATPLPDATINQNGDDQLPNN